MDLRLRQSETSLDYRCTEQGPASLSGNADEGFMEWASNSKGPPVPIQPPVEQPEHVEEEGELLLSEVSDMLDQFNLEVRRGDVDGSKEGATAAKAPAKPSAGIPAVLGASRKRDEVSDLLPPPALFEGKSFVGEVGDKFLSDGHSQCHMNILKCEQWKVLKIVVSILGVITD